MKKKCDICMENMTDISAEVMENTNVKVYVCKECLEKSKKYFIFKCMNCGKVYFREKNVMIARMKDPALKRAYMECKDMQLIQGIDICISCDSQGILDYVMQNKHSGVGNA